MLRRASFRMFLVLCLTGIALLAGNAIAQNAPDAPQPPDGQMMAPPDAPMPPEGGPMPDGKQMPEGGPMPDGGQMQDNLRINWQALNLTQEQQEKIQQLRRDFQVNSATTREELRFAQQDLRKEMDKEQIDRAKIDALLTQIAESKQQLSKGAVQNLLDIKKILTVEQRQQVADMQGQMPAEWRGLKMTQEQRSQIKDVLNASRQENQQLAEDVRKLREDLREELLTVEPDVAKIQELQTTIAEKDAALEKSRIDAMLQVNDLLTPEQREQLKKVRARNKQNRQDNQDSDSSESSQNNQDRQNRQDMKARGHEGSNQNQSERSSGNGHQSGRSSGGGHQK